MKAIIGMPSGRGDVRVEVMASVIDCMKELARIGIEADFVAVSYAEPAVARNRLAAYFLKSGADLLIMQDDDVAIRPAIVKRMIEVDRPMVGVYLPQRRMDLERYAGHARAGLSPRAARHATSPLIGPATEQDNCILEVDKIGGGFLILKREVFELIDRSGQVKAFGFGLPGDQSHLTGYFNNIVDQEGTSYLGEDYSFCRRYAKAGGRIFAYKGPGVTHHGSFGFES